MNEERGKECSGVSERYNIPGHSTPVPKCTCCMCCYLHARLSDTPEFARAATCTRVMFGYSRVPIWDIDGNSGVSEHHARANSSTCKLRSIRKSHVQHMHFGTGAEWPGILYRSETPEHSFPPSLPPPRPPHHIRRISNITRVKYINNSH